MDCGIEVAETALEYILTQINENKPIEEIKEYIEKLLSSLREYRLNKFEEDFGLKR